MNLNFSEFYLEQQSRHLILKELGLEAVGRIKSGKVLLIGLGGLGSIVSLYLVHAGIGTLGLCDYDRVDASNLGRQVTYSFDDLKEKKVYATIKYLKSKNFESELIPIPEKVTTHNFSALTEGYDLIVEAVDDVKEKVLIHDLAIKHKKPMVHSGVLKLNGQLLTIIPQKTACLRCFFYDLSDFSNSGNCAKDGVFSPLVGVMGSLQAGEVLKYFATPSKLSTNQLLKLNLENYQLKKIKINYKSGCSFCGKNTVKNT